MVKMIFNMCIIHFITEVQHYSTQTVIRFISPITVWLWVYSLHFLQLETDCKMVYPVLFKALFKLIISFQMPNHCPLFKFTWKQNTFGKEIKIFEWRYFDLGRNVCLLLNYNRNSPLLVHYNTHASGNSLSGHFRAEDYISWRTL